MGKTLDEIVKRYYDESVGGMVQKCPSILKRGEGAEKEYFIYKIDLVGSTIFTWSRSHQTYLKMAHTFLSSVHEITRHFGADDNQVEYAGDSVIAYYPKSVGAEDVLIAAYYCRAATLQMKSLDTTLRKFPFLTKSVVHFGKLIMAKIGPHGDSVVSAIGPELHKACKMERDVPSGEGRASKAFREQLPFKQRLFLSGNYKETQVLKLSEPSPTVSTAAIGSLLSFSDFTGMRANALTSLASSSRNALSGIATPPSPQYETKCELVDYSIKWEIIQRHIESSQKLSR